jgi:peptidoglycan/xylan/chitin deacetylase (PgdA/CDA1 family)
MQKNKKSLIRKNKRKLNFSIIFIAAILFLLYAVWLPSSQILGRTTYKNENNVVSLTFDDGPGPDTANILRILKENNLTATFFITCEHIDESEIPLIKEMSENGDVVALHGENHKMFQGYKKLDSCKQMLENITGKEIKYFRPPYGFRSPNTIIASHQLKMTVVTWSVFPRDYMAKNPEQIIERVKKNLKSDSIVCFHDGPSNRENTADALPDIIQYIKEKHYKVGNLES